MDTQESRILENAREIHNSYLPLRHSHGWFGPRSVAFFSVLLAYQNDTGVKGDMIEVGVLNGSSAFLTIVALRADERQILIDSRRAEGFNEKYALLSEAKKKQVTFLEAESHDAIGKFNVERARFIHIDGGHRKETVCQDIVDYLPFLGADGVLCFDDFLVQRWPAVTEAIIESLPKTDALPFALLSGKLYCCRSPCYERYFAMAESAVKSLELFGTAQSVIRPLLGAQTVVLTLRPNDLTASHPV